MCHASAMSFLKTIAVLTGCALSLSGCRESSCLEKGYEQISTIIRGVNEGWCTIDSESDYAIFTCRNAILQGIVANGVFDLTLDAPGVQMTLANDRLSGVCGAEKVVLDAPEQKQEIHQVQSVVRGILRDLEMD